MNARKGCSYRERIWYCITDDAKNVLAQRFEQSTKWIAKVTNTNKYVYCKCCKTRKLLKKNVLVNSFSNVSESVSNTHLSVKMVLAGIRQSNVISVNNDSYFDSIKLKEEKPLKTFY